mmetsp:Transcript_29086/g.84223  ORF Transcript_29086/g.84223 Transcript_29086/m.84223 type:complete len:216 (+) Transcript_29086:623-1270(+)
MSATTRSRSAARLPFSTAGISGGASSMASRPSSSERHFSSPSPSLWTWTCGRWASGRRSGARAALPQERMWASAPSRAASWSRTAPCSPTCPCPPCGPKLAAVQTRRIGGRPEGASVHGASSCASSRCPCSRRTSSSASRLRPWPNRCGPLWRRSAPGRASGPRTTAMCRWTHIRPRSTCPTTGAGSSTSRRRRSSSSSSRTGSWGTGPTSAALS